MFLTVANGSGVPQFSTSTVYGDNEQSVVGSSLPLNQWVHLAVTLSGPVGTLYVNGVAVGSNANMDFAPFEIKDTSQDWLGRSQYSSDPYLNGKIEDFSIYQAALFERRASIRKPSDLAVPSPPVVPASLWRRPSSATRSIWPGRGFRAMSYSVWWATVHGGPYTALATLLTGTTYADDDLTAGTNYYYVVTAANLGGNGASVPA